KKKGPDRNSPFERLSLWRGRRIRQPTAGWPQRPRHDAEYREHQRRRPDAGTVASEEVRRDGARPPKEGARVRPFLEPREPRGDDRGGPGSLPEACDVGVIERVSQMDQLQANPFDLPEVPHRSSGQLEDHDERRGPEDGDADPAPPARRVNGRLLVARILECLRPLGLHGVARHIEYGLRV